MLKELMKEEKVKPEPKTKQINFSKRWDKLTQSVFSTIRGPSNSKKYKKGENIDISLNNEFQFKAKIINIEIVRLAEIRFEFLIKDTNCKKDDFEIKSRKDFLSLINEFRSKNKNMPIVKEESLVCIITIFKINPVLLETGITLANDLIQLIGLKCEKIEVAGSIRRGNKIQVKDVELLTIPKFKEIRKQSGLDSLLGTQSNVRQINLLKTELRELEKKFRINIIKMGERYVQFLYLDSIIVDLFIVTWANYGVMKMIRTGPANYSRQFMIELNIRGEYKIKDGYLWGNPDEWEIIPIGTEEGLYKTVGFPFKEPKDRVQSIFEDDLT